jgi:hypothetical protein
VEASETRGTTALVYCLISSSLYTGTVQGCWSTPPTGLTAGRCEVHPNWSDGQQGRSQLSTMLWRHTKEPWTKESREKIYKNFRKIQFFPKGFLLNHGKKVGFQQKSWGPLKNVKTKSGSYSGLGLSTYVIKWNSNLAGLSL